MNLILISPNFPPNFIHFAVAASRAGLTVLGIGDTPFDMLRTELGYPVVAKPDIGVGAADTYQINTVEELEQFFSKKAPVDYNIERYVHGSLHSFDGLTDRDGRIVY